MKANGTPNWTPADSAELYGIRNWGAGYFDLSDDGAVTVNVEIDGRRVGVSIPQIIEGVRSRGHQMPVLLRIENVLDAQITRLNESFNRAIAQLGYSGSYRGVFPIKVNQQCQVIEEIARFGASYGHGLEAGSKAELLIALASLTPDTGGHIVCNGYKDEEFVSLGLQALKLGHRVTFVIETPTELPTILEASRRLGIRPILGIRVKLASRVSGAWSESSGDRSIFGLTTAQIVETLDQLRAHDMLDCLQLLHYHLGSQIPNIRDIRSGVLEACRYYADLAKEGAALGFLDLGGGLAVDYDGTQTNFEYSKNYSLDEYCIDVIETIMGTLDPEGIAHPVIVTESGRATVAYSSVLLFNILDVTSFEAGAPPALGADAPELLRNLADVLNGISAKNLQECFNDAVFYRDEIRELFKRGQIRLRSLSIAEQIFLEIVRIIARETAGSRRVPPGLDGLEDSLADIYYGNFSVFQSLPDVWAIEQVFPVMPIHRHEEKPTRQAIIADITCDSDGKIDRFIDPRGLRKTLPVHPLRDGEPYYLGVFLVGAYQETLGDLHNLMGDTNVVSVRINADGSFDFVREMDGDSIADVLSYVEYQPQQLLEQFRRTAEGAVRAGRISPQERQALLSSFDASLRGYTYFEE